MNSPAVDAEGLLVSIVVPAYDEEAVLDEFHRRLSDVLRAVPWQAEVVYVNDGSTDATLSAMQRLKDSDPRIAIVDLSRNFGKEIAMTAGLDYANGDAVVVIDADLQDPPELIPELVKHFREGYDMVYAQRASRSGESLVKRGTAHAFYRLIRAFSRVKIPEDTGDFRLLSRRAVDALKLLREQHRFMKGLFAWIGYRQKAVPYERHARAAGHTKWSYWRLWNFALEGFTSFTIAPLKIASYLGIVTAVVSFLYALRIIYKTLAYGDPVAGYPSLMVAVLFFGGVQLITIGIVGEYLGRMFDETKRRPLYFLNDYKPAEAMRKPRPAAGRDA